jgi:hypothetical protein
MKFQFKKIKFLYVQIKILEKNKKSLIYLEIKYFIKNSFLEFIYFFQYKLN